MKTINPCSMYPLKQIPSEAKIKKIVRKILFGTHMHCPRCHSRKVYTSEDRYRCKQCRRPFSLTSHTWLSNMKLDWQTWYFLLWSWLNGLPVEQTMKFTGLSEVSLREWYEKFRINIPYDTKLFLTSTVQMDEAYTRHVSIIAAKGISQKKIRIIVLPKPSVAREDALQFIVRTIMPGAQLATDGAAIYKGIEHRWPVAHTRDIHRKFEFAHTSEIEGIFGNLRTFIRRKYHHVSCSKLPFVVAEFQAKFNHPEMFQNPHEYLKNSLHLVPTC